MAFKVRGAAARSKFHRQASNPQGMPKLQAQIARLLELGAAFREQQNMLVERLPVLRLEQDFQDCSAGRLCCRRILAQPVLLLQVQQAFQGLSLATLLPQTSQNAELPVVNI